ncbi:hypothetical protein WA026_023060 [Henosepilachna vigintioctopunctata]|uniref:Methyltransferase type 11 domain-containing protein n=1 Tax=Henosepilachna vigintioctopunctata TaxID=420089 RepID=A0AAW1V5P7_9CUCU
MSLSPHRYSKITFHLKGVTEYAQQYFKLIQWKKNSRILDIGSGPGHLLLQIEPLFPKDYAEILCIDKLEEMVNYFNSHKSDPRMKAIAMDIQTTSLPSDLKNRFDFVFSCNSLMYWANIRQSFRNISQLMNESGQLFFIWPKKGDVHDIYKAMNIKQRWAPHTNEFKNWINYFDTESPTDTLKTEFERVGIEIVKSETKKLSFEDQEKSNFTAMFDSLDYISKRIPKDDLAEYKQEYHELVHEKLLMERNSDNKMKWKLPFEYILVVAKKS